jgi:hypothetical protein
MRQVLTSASNWGECCNPNLGFTTHCSNMGQDGFCAGIGEPMLESSPTGTSQGTLTMMYYTSYCNRKLVL